MFWSWLWPVLFSVLVPVSVLLVLFRMLCVLCWCCLPVMLGDASFEFGMWGLSAKCGERRTGGEASGEAPERARRLLGGVLRRGFFALKT